LKWKYATGYFVRSSPAVSGGVVYIGSDDGKVYALNSSTGALKWNYATGDIIRSSPAVSGGVVYIGSFDSNVYALDADTGALKWNYVTGGWVESSPAVSDGVVYVGSYDKNIYALDARTGALKWNYVAWAYVAASPAVSGDVVYVGANAFSRAPNHDVGVDGVIVAKTVVGGYSAVLGEGLGLNMSVTVTNFGTFTEIFNVTIYANTTQEASENITLTSGQSAIVNVSWRTNPPTLAYGNYTISACADTVEGETDIENNNNSNVGLLVVAGAGDLTGGTANAFDFVPDGNVNIIDVAVVSKVMTQNSPPAPANCDVSGPTVGMPDGKIDISDVALAAKHFGNHYTYP
jgi:outer membrane protein assembly factor BamB